MKCLTFGVMLSAFSCAAANAAPCNININHGIVINPKHIRVLDHDRTILQINTPRQLFIGGREVQLSEQQQLLLGQYSSGIRKQVPEIVSIAIDGLEVSLKAVNKVIAGLTGENSAAHQKIQEKFRAVQVRLHKRFRHSEQNYFIAPQDFENFDDLFTGDFELELEQVISTSVGNLLNQVEQVISSQGEALPRQSNKPQGEQRPTMSSELKIKSLDKYLAPFSQELKQEMGHHTSILNEKTKQFCQGLIKLNQIEQELKQQIPQLNQFALINKKQNIKG
ncbi:DUF2884 family protein [Thalassomonas viridans]|uniref:DUF2884 family protein n=1 Tax=Thalassomonas viridans TaxID=137584 RepID=A0AAF0CAJ8_9GAMM|nr:DUF2884 family protein [Thalassomonas viridans]WDE06601.1 DUF2884 family protein [Thalassomonas viridans]